MCGMWLRMCGLVAHALCINLPHSALLSMYETLILPHFDYCDIVWGSASDTLITRVTKLENCCAWVLTSSDCYSQLLPSLDQCLNWITFRDRVIFHKAALDYKSLNRLLP